MGFENEKERIRKRELARKRPAHAKMYTLARWKKLRLKMLKLHPRCAVCRAKATEVDHKLDHKGDWGLFYGERNLQCLCKPCHSRKTAITAGFAKGGVDKMIGRCDESGLPIDDRHPWNL